MEAINIYLQYLYAPIAIALYVLHIKIVRIDSKVTDYLDLKKEIFVSLKELEKNVHYLIEIRKEELTK